MPTKQWLEANKERVAAQKKARYEANKEYLKEKARLYHHANKEACSARAKAYYQKNKEKLIANATSYYHETKETRKHINDLRHKRYRETNKETIKQNNEKWLNTGNNRERMNQKAKEWRQANPGKTRSYVRNRQAAQMQRTPKWLTHEDFSKIEMMYAKAKMLEVETGIQHHVDHIIPMRGKYVSGLHVPDNLQILTANDNVRKSNRYVGA
jgi:hypothetical protein